MSTAPFPFSRFFRASTLGLLLAAGCQAIPPYMSWLPVTDEERSLKTPQLDKDAGAEALFWRVYLMDEAQGQDLQTVLYHYIRLKIFTDRGKEQMGTVSIPHYSRTAIVDVVGRTIKADGTIVELHKDAVFERDVVRTGGLKEKAVSFAMPAVEPGAIVEYRYKEIRGRTVDHVRLQLQLTVPAHLVRYMIKPYTHERFQYGMRSATFNITAAPLVKEADGFYSVTYQDVPAFKEEPLMPAEAQVRPWMLLYYTKDDKLTPEKYWPEVGKRKYEEYKLETKVTGEVREATASAIEGATAADEKIQRIHRYCVTQIKNLRADDVTEDQRAKAKQNSTPADTLKRGMGTPHDLNMLFTAMVSAAGLDARMAWLSTRDDMVVNRNFTDDYLLRAYDIAVKVDGKWRFYDVAQKDLPFGMLRWQEEGMEALISDPKEPVFVRTDISGPEKSASARSGVFTLGEDGTLSGDATLRYTGHSAARRRADMESRSPAQREEVIHDLVRSHFSNAEISAVKIEGLEDPEQALVYSYHVVIPSYAQRTGKRLLFQPGYFQRGEAPRFPASERKYDLHFDYAFSESDTVTIKMPAGFDLESPEAPGNINMGAPGEYLVSLGTTPGRELIYKRRLIFGRNTYLIFPAQYYGNVKAIFDAIHQRDGNSITLRQTASAKGVQ
ncbi:MAG: DUF3857 domain-containing protein [Bryobacteraceae bacterium]